MKNNLTYIRDVVMGYSREKLARLSGVSRQTIETIEKEERTPYVDTAIKLARALHVSTEDIFGVGVKEGENYNEK